MSNYKTVLIAIDLNADPEQVLTKASKLIDQSTHVFILNVASDPSHIYANYETKGTLKNMSVSITEQTRIRSLERIHKLVEYGDFANATILVEFGRTSEVIVEKAKQLQSDIIIIGNHGRHGVGLLLGSTANAVLHYAKCDVLAIRMHDDKNGSSN